MSEYEPITKELYDIMDFLHGPYSDEVDTVSADYEEFSVACSKIDSIHAKLEDENQSLKNIIAKLKHNTTVMELFCKNLEGAVKERKDVTLWGVDYTAYPVDERGQQWHLRDMAEDTSGHHIGVHEVYALRMGLNGWDIECSEYGGYGSVTGSAGAFSHYHAPTVEDVLREFMEKWNSILIGGSDKENELFAEYAAKLRLAGDAE